LADGNEDPFPEDIWDQRQAQLIAAPAPVRAALMNGFDRLCDLSLLIESCEPRPEHLVTLPRADVEPALMTLARAMTLREIDHVSRADYGTHADRHRAALMDLLADPNVAYPPNEYWFPAEVVELVSHVPKSPGYIPCMAIVLLDALRDGDRMENASFRLGRQWAEIQGLPQRARDAFLATFRNLYESGPCWSAEVPVSFTLPWVEDIGPPSATSNRRRR
jgi:transposase